MDDAKGKARQRKTIEQERKKDDEERLESMVIHLGVDVSPLCLPPPF